MPPFLFWAEMLVGEVLCPYHEQLATKVPQALISYIAA